MDYQQRLAVWALGEPRAGVCDGRGIAAAVHLGVRQICPHEPVRHGRARVGGLGDVIREKELED